MSKWDCRSCGRTLGDPAEEFCPRCQEANRNILAGLVAPTYAERLLGMSEHCVYVIGPDDLALPVKVGISTNPLKRYRSIQSCSPLPLVVLGVMRCQPSLEFQIHAALASDRLHGEWFRRSPATLQLIDFIAGGKRAELAEWLRERST